MIEKESNNQAENRARSGRPSINRWLLIFIVGVILAMVVVPGSDLTKTVSRVMPGALEHGKRLYANLLRLVNPAKPSKSTSDAVPSLSLNGSAPQSSKERQEVIDIAAQRDIKRADVSPHYQSQRLSHNSLQLLARAEALIQAKRLPEAMKLYQALARLEPGAAIVHREFGITAAASSNYWLATQELEESDRLEPDNALTHRHLGLAYQSLFESEKAKRELQKATMLDPKDAASWFSLGNVYASLAEYAKAGEAFRQALGIRPDWAAAHNNLAASDAIAGNMKGAIEEFEKALALEPDMASAHYGLGLALYNVKDYRAAIYEFKRTLALNPDCADARSKMDLAYRKTNNGTIGGAGLN